MASVRAKKKGPVAPENQTPSEAVAAEMLARYGDLAPSLRRILDAGLGEVGQLFALNAFRDSLTTPGDPMRDPRNAIEAGAAHEASAVDTAEVGAETESV